MSLNIDLSKIFMDAMEDLYRNDCEKLITDFHREIRDKEVNTSLLLCIGLGFRA